MLNIPSSVIDPNYRYKMPKMQLKIESKGNGVKTNIVNLPDVGKHLRINESYILKYFGFEKASQTIEKASQAKSNKQGKSNTSYIIQGEFTEADLLKILDKFIDKYVLCPKCKLPEMHLFLEKDRVHGKCDSCPFNGEIDNKHRLTAFILKNPPEYKPQATKRNQLKVIKIEEGGKQEEGKDDTMEKKEEEIEEEKKATDLFSSESIEFGNEEFEELLQYTKDFVKRKKGEDFDLLSAHIVADLKPLGLKKALYAYVLFHTFFTINIHKEIKENSRLYIHLMKKLAVKDNKNATSKEEAQMLRNRGVEIETMLNVQYMYLELNKEKDFSGKISTILMKLLQGEIFSEQFIIQWSQGNIPDLDKMFMYNQERDEKFKEMGKDFIQYIANDSDSEDSEEK